MKYADWWTSLSHSLAVICWITLWNIHLQPISVIIPFTAPRSKVRRPPAIRIGDTFLSVGDTTKFLGLWWDSQLSFKKHISVLKLSAGRPSISFKWSRTWSGEGTRHTPDAVPGHYSLQSGLWLRCVWHSIEHQPAHWIKTGTWSILHQPSLQFVWWDLWRNIG